MIAARNPRLADAVTLLVLLVALLLLHFHAMQTIATRMSDIEASLARRIDSTDGRVNRVLNGTWHLDPSTGDITIREDK